VGLGNGDGTFQPLLTSPSRLTSFGTAEVALGDINNDGFLDFALANAGSSSVDIALGNGDGTFQSRNVINFPVPGGFTLLVTDVELADLDNDGNLDLVAGYGLKVLARLKGFGNGTFAAVTSDSFVTLPTGAASYQIKVGDFNNDGNFDVAALQLSTFANVPSPIRILLGLGDLNFSSNVATLNAPTTTFGLTAADVNRDGNLDLITASEAQNYANPNLAQGGVLSVFIGQGDGTFAAAVPYGANLFGYSVVLAADVNADGYPDIVASNSPSGFPHIVASQLSRGLAVLLNNGDGTFGNVTFYDHGGTGTGWPAAADFNRDGLLDILVPNVFDDSFSILFAGPPLPPLAAPLRPDGGPSPAKAASNADLQPLTKVQLAIIVDAALARWADAGLTPGELDRLRGVQWSVADLNGDYLGLSTRNTIALDVTAAGFGWFVDPTPNGDEEYEHLLAEDSLRAAPRTRADDEMDLLTVVLHELGHILGLEHDDAVQTPQSLMSSTLPPGLRRLPRRM
jgi:FG-GAP-like repeat/Matrixin